MNTTKTDLKIEKAGKYLEAAKINQENLWKRRNVEWRTAFSLWAAFAIATVYIYIDVEWPSQGPLFWIFPIVIIIVYSIAICLHYGHHRRIFISNEKDLEFINYYSSIATWELDNYNFNKKKKPSRPDTSTIKVNNKNKNCREIKRIRKENKEKRKLYFKYHKWRINWAPIYVTILISVISCVLIIAKGYKLRNTDVMEKQKVITVNINTKAISNSKYNEIEPKKINKYLNEGYIIQEKSSTILDRDSSFINLTFILKQVKPKRDKDLDSKSKKSGKIFFRKRLK